MIATIFHVLISAPFLFDSVNKKRDDRVVPPQGYYVGC